MEQDDPSMEWKIILADASHSLTQLDAARLEEMAISCAALVRERQQVHCDLHWRPTTLPRATESEMAVFTRVLEATKANLEVLRRVCERRTTQLEYGQARGLSESLVENDHGDD